MTNRVFKVGSREYIVESQIVQGGNGIVWKVTCEGIEYALKQLNTEDSKKKERFINEINFCKKSESENIVKIIESGENHGKIFYVMPMYESDLAKIIQKTINLEDAFNYSIQIVKGIKYLHENKVIHRDLKPENILINPGVAIADLGIAHFENSILTAKNELVANRWYAAPEQKIKGNSKNISYAADIYSLGLIINEIFTGEKLEGSDYKKISHRFPWLEKLDDLVERCIKANAIERPNIVEIFHELILIKGESEKEFYEIQNNLKTNNQLSINCNKCETQYILKQATIDVLIATYLYKNLGLDELYEYNHNYNANISYKLKKSLRTIYFKSLVLEKCKRKFEYEGNGVGYTSIDLEKEENKKIYDTFYEYLLKNNILSNEILKYFQSCCDYHCKEIISSLKDEEKEVEDLNDAPIIYLIQKLKTHDIDYKEIKEGILINWNNSQSTIDEENYRPLKLNKNNADKLILIDKFRDKFKATISINKDEFIVRFNTIQDYEEFKTFALDLAKPHYIFEGDVLDLLRVNREFQGIVELNPWGDFDIKRTLAMILGEREII